jgi:phosphoesterase RecJ-like protein
MLGHVHPDADVLGTLLALGAALEAAGWSVAYGGPHPAPGALGFLPGVDRYRVLPSVAGPLDVAVLTDCPNPDRTEGLIDQTKTAASVVVNIDHHPDNRRYGHVNWIDTGAAATGEMVYGCWSPSGCPHPGHRHESLHGDPHRHGLVPLLERHPETFGSRRAGGGRAQPAFVVRALRAAGDRRAALLGESLARVEVSEDGRVAWLALPNGAVPETFIESEELVNYPRSIASVRVACRCASGQHGQGESARQGRRRRQSDRRALGGGGHPNAAGCTVPGALTAVTRDVLAAVQEAMRGEPASRPGRS